jgi:murein DD-endopeptidase MepM/ murein hydrolase activator NlpD
MKVFRGKHWVKDVLKQSKNILTKIQMKDLTTGMKKRQYFQPMTSWLNKNRFSIIKGFGVSAGAFGLIITMALSGNHYVKVNTNEVFHVYVDDQKAGVVSKPEVVEDYILDKINQIEAQYTNAHMVLNSDEITYRSEKAFKLESNDSVVLNNLEKLIVAKAVGVELRVDGKLIGIVKDKETADAILARIQEKYLPGGKPESKVTILSQESREEDLASGKSHLEEVGFVEQVDLESVDTEPSAIADPEEIIKKLETGDVKPTKYTVVEGDCVLCIAGKFDISPNVIYDNNDIVNDNLQIGDVLDLTVLQPTLTTRTVETLQEMLEVHYETTYELDDTLKVGNNIIVKPGVEGKKLVTYRVTNVNGMEIERNVTTEEMVLEPVTAIIRKGTKVIKGEGTGSFAWPVSGARISSSYGMRWGRLHQGMDMTSRNKNILAADNGVVTYAGYNSGYGNHIIIDHKNGFQTLYAHLSKFAITKGKIVEKGEKIGVMGTTGNSTGVHLHFEIEKNGTALNPSKYLN